MTSYAPKRIGYKHDGYVARMEAAYIDYNSHLDREQMTTDGKKVFSRKWSKRSSRWHDVPVPCPKTFIHSRCYSTCPAYLNEAWLYMCLKG